MFLMVLIIYLFVIKYSLNIFEVVLYNAKRTALVKDLYINGVISEDNVLSGADWTAFPFSVDER